MMARLLRLAGSVALLFNSAAALDLVLGDEGEISAPACLPLTEPSANMPGPASVKEAASTIAFGLVKYYTGNNTGDNPGNLPDPYFWWEAGAMFGTLIDYWALTGDDSYNAITSQALVHQATPLADFAPRNQTRTMGNDDQGFWAMAAMSAAEHNFPNPPPDQPQWLALAQSVFNQYVDRWDTIACGGGLRWQLHVLNTGFDYKNSISNGCFFNIASRLARYTGNQSYAEWATKVWDWEQGMGLISDVYEVHDGRHTNLVTNECLKIDVNLWTYNAGIYLHGASVMYNMTKSTLWEQRVNGLLNATANRFFNNSIMFEQLCEPHETCNVDQRSFKGYLTRWMAATAQMAPQTYGTIRPLLEADAAAAARACTGTHGGFRGHQGTACGFKWTTGGFDGSVGVGEQMNALSAVMYTLVDQAVPPLTADTGGTSVGNPGANTQPYEYFQPLTNGDRVGAWFLTVAIMVGVVVASYYMVK